MNARQREIWKDIEREKAFRRPDVRRLHRLARAMEAAGDYPSTKKAKGDR